MEHNDARTIAVLAKHSPLSSDAVAEKAAEIIRLAHGLHRVCEADCNDGGNPAREKREARMLAKVTALVAEVVPGAEVKYQGDPRGYVVKIKFPADQPSNEWGGLWGVALWTKNTAR